MKNTAIQQGQGDKNLVSSTLTLLGPSKQPYNEPNPTVQDNNDPNKDHNSSMETVDTTGIFRSR